jgi:hypothetical protein
MYRMTIQIMILLTIIALWLGGGAMAFTLRFGSVPGSDLSSAMPATEDTDLPTPQFFRVAIGPDGVTLGATHPSEGYNTSLPEVRFREEYQAQSANGQESQHVSSVSPDPRLSGAELLLLRRVHTVADRQ